MYRAANPASVARPAGVIRRGSFAWSGLPLTFSLALTGLLCGPLGCSQPTPEPKADRPTPVEVWIVHPDTLSERAILTGVLEAHRSVDLVAEVSGPLETLRRDVGDAVASGEILASLEKGVARENLRSAEAGQMAAAARHAVAREDHVRDSTLRASGDIAAAAYESSRMAWQAAAAELEGARATRALALRQFEKSDLRAPFSGYVSRRHCEIGTFVSPGLALFRIVDIDSLRLRLGVAQRHLPRVHPGQAVAVTSEAFPGRIFHGRVRSISPEADAISRTFPVEVILPNPPDEPLRDGLVVGATLVLAELPDVIALPREAILRYGAEDYVFLVVDSLAHRRAVVPGPMIGDRAVIRSGVRTGETVVVSGMQNLRDGDRVSVEVAAPDRPGQPGAAALGSTTEEVR